MSGRLPAMVQRTLNLALGAAVLILAGWLSTQHKLQADWTAGNRNSLTAASQRLLATLPDPIAFTAYVFPDAELRREIAARVAPYQRLRDDISLRFVDPATDPAAVREIGVGQSGEIVIEYQGRRENLRAVSEATITAALQRLAYAGQAQIRFLGGHGERSPDDQEQSGYSSFAAGLREKGLQLSRFTFAEQGAVPEDTDVLVLAAPQRPLLDAEIARLVDWVTGGGRLLWLFDPDSPPLPELAAALAIETQPGTVIYQDYELLQLGHPGLALVGEYAPHPVTRELVDLTVFPLAAGLFQRGSDDWLVSMLAMSPARSWLETGELGENLIFDQGTDVDGPIGLGLAATRHLALPAAETTDGEENASAAPPARLEQRVVVFADSDFLSNAFINQVGNRQLGVNILQWLASRDAQIDIDVPSAPDLSLNLSPLQTLAIALGFVLILPALLLAIGVLRWWTRRRLRQ